MGEETTDTTEPETEAQEGETQRITKSTEYNGTMATSEPADEAAAGA